MSTNEDTKTHGYEASRDADGRWQVYRYHYRGLETRHGRVCDQLTLRGYETLTMALSFIKSIRGAHGDN